MKKVALIVGAVVFLLMGAVALFVGSEWTYIQRLRHFRKQLPTPVEWYEPKQVVKGATAAREFRRVTPEEAKVSMNAIAQALEIAKKGNALAFLIAKDGAIVTEYYAPEHGPDRWTDSASMMKTVTALLIGIAISDGRIKSVDETAVTYLPSWKKDERKEITIRNLLQMCSGLRPEGEYDDPFSDACYLALGTDARYVVDGCPLVETPGKRFDYNNVNYQALGLILQNATGRAFVDYLSEKLWQPLGNRDAALWLDKAGGVPRTFGYCFATAQDWARVGQLILDRGKVGAQQIVPAAWIDFMCTPSPSAPNYGAGIWTGVDDSKAAPFAYKGIVALNGRNKQRVYVLPRERMLIVRVGPQVRGWDDSYFPNMFARGRDR